MSWHKTTFPSTSADNPDVLRIGNLGAEAFYRENKPQGFGMFHAKRGIPDQPGSILIVYLSPVASEMCPELRESYTWEPCEAPARDEQDMAWVLGDPWTKNLLREWFVEPQPRPTEEEEIAAAQQAQQEAQQAPTEEVQQAQAAN
jgi:hypothetical protein